MNFLVDMFSRFPGSRVFCFNKHCQLPSKVLMMLCAPISDISEFLIPSPSVDSSLFNFASLLGKSSYPRQHQPTIREAELHYVFNGHLGISSSAKRLFIYFAQFFLFIFSYSLVKDVYVCRSQSFLCLLQIFSPSVLLFFYLCVSFIQKFKFLVK